jgi:hypothetical protein
MGQGPSYVSQYPNGFTYGVTIRGLPVTVGYPGQVMYVNNSTVFPAGGVSGNNAPWPTGGTYLRPFSTIEYALTQCVANRGDIIMVMPNHAETISTAAILTLDTAGVAIVGLGSGSNRPTLTFTAAAANIPITAANVSVKNILHVANFADVASLYTATGTSTPTGFTIEDCEFRDTSSILNALTVVTGNATAGSMTGFRFANNRISSLGTTAATTAIKLAAAADRVTINNNFGCWAALSDTAGLLATGAASVTNFEMTGNILSRPSTSSTGGLMVSTSGTAWSGQCSGNMIWGLDNSAQIWIATGTTLGFNQNFCPITAAADKSGLINPAAV